jgi:integrase
MPRPIKYNNAWRVNFRHEGKRYRRQGFPTAASAQQYINQVIRGEPAGEVPVQDLAALMNEYNIWSEKIKGKAASTMINQRLILRILSEWAQSQKLSRISDLDIHAMRQFQSYYFENAPFFRKPNHRIESDHRSSWNKCRDRISAFFNWCLERDHIEKNPVRSSEFKVKILEKKPLRIISQQELATLFEYFDRYDDGARVPIGTFYRILLYTGMRRNELINLKWPEVSLERRQITVAKTKTGQPRSIPISSKLLPYLEELPTKDKTYVFDGGDGSPLYAKMRYWEILRRATREIGIRDIRLHDFRHTFASNLAMANVPIGIIQKLLGHTDIKQTQIYLDYYPERFQESIERLDFEEPE